MNDADEQMVNLNWEGSSRLRALPAEAGPNCPQEYEIVSLVDGNLPRERAEELLAHCADCDYCALRLKDAVAWAEPFTAEQKALVEKLSPPSLKAARKAQETGEVKVVPIRVVGKPRRLRWLAVAAAALLAAIIPPSYLNWQGTQASQQLARELAQQRPMEFRLDGIGYGPYHQSMGASEKVTVNQKDIKPGTPDSWRAAVLESNLDAAIQELDAALRKGPRTASLLNDLAAVHAARGDRLRLDSEYQTALQLLDEALAQSANFQPALFNRALVLDRLHRRDESREAAARELQSDPDPGWKADVEEIANRK